MPSVIFASKRRLARDSSSGPPEYSRFSAIAAQDALRWRHQVPREVLDGNPPARHPSPASPARTTTAGDDRVALEAHADGVDLGARAGPRHLDPVGTLARNRRTRIGLVDRRLGAIRQRALRRALQAGGEHYRLRHP